MKNMVSITLLVFSTGSFAQNAIPAGTILPVQLNSTLKSDRAKPGQEVTARLMQDVPLPSGSRIRAGSKILGHVADVKPAGENRAEIAVRFEELAIGGRRIPITTSLRAVASMMDVDAAQVPESGPDRGTPQYRWTTRLIGGDVNYGGGSAVAHGSEIVGYSVPPGVLVHLTSSAANTPTTSRCRGEAKDDDRLQALWVFSSDACGIYGFPGVTVTHAGRSEPIGEITLASDKGNINIRGGSGMLLLVNGSKAP